MCRNKKYKKLEMVEKYSEEVREKLQKCKVKGLRREL